MVPGGFSCVITFILGSVLHVVTVIMHHINYLSIVNSMRG